MLALPIAQPHDVISTGLSVGHAYVYSVVCFIDRRAPPVVYVGP